MWEALYGKDSSRKKVFTAAARPQFITVLKSQGRRLFSQFAELRVDGGPKSGEYSVEGKLLPTCRYCCLSLKSFRNQELLQRPYNNGVVTVSFSAYLRAYAYPCFGHPTNHRDHVTVTT